MYVAPFLTVPALIDRTMLLECVRDSVEHFVHRGASKYQLESIFALHFPIAATKKHVRFSGNDHHNVGGTELLVALEPLQHTKTSMISSRRNTDVCE